MGLIWALVWFGAGLVILVGVGPGAADVPFPIGFGLLGFLAGVTFSGILGMIEGRRSFAQMSLARFALWGGVGGFLISLPLSFASGGGAFLVLGPILALAGASCAAGSLALARRAEGRALPGPAAEADSDEDAG